MPTYTFLDNNTREYFEKVLRISERDQFLEDNPHIESAILEPPMLGDPVRLGVKTIDNGFREVLSKIHNSQPKSNLADKLSRR
jgi:hypothetical protein